MEKFVMTRPVFGAAVSMYMILAFVILLCVFLAVAFVTAGTYSLFIEGSDLCITSVFYNTHVPLSRIDVDGLRTVDLDTEEIRMEMRTNGIGLPGLQVGWFLRGGKKYKLYVTDRCSVVSIPLKDEYTILFSSRDASKIVEMLKKVLKHVW